MTNDHGYPPISPEVRALYNKKRPTEADLLEMATIEADQALRSLPPHCLPTAGGLPHNPDHANCAAHRCWAFLKQLAPRIDLAMRVVDAARFIRDFADDMGTCACCDHGIGKSDEADGLPCDCPARQVRAAFRAYDEVAKK